MAFRLGCIQPDKNPATYLKGSFRGRWLRGHNWSNASRYIARLSQRLERRKKLWLMDYYALGKLIHYTADAFTCSHNDHFPAQLHIHRQYENRLQAYFLEYLKQSRPPQAQPYSKVMDAISFHHRQYRNLPADMHTDCSYCVLVTSMIVCSFLA